MPAYYGLFYEVYDLSTAPLLLVQGILRVPLHAQGCATADVVLPQVFLELSEPRTELEAP